MRHIHISTFRLHAECPKCGEYRSNSVLIDGKDKIILVCGCEHEDKEKPDAQVTPRRDAESLLN